MPHHGVEVLHLKDARCNKHTPNSKAITSSALLSYDQQLANNKRRLTAKDKYKDQMMQGHQSTGILCDGGYLIYVALLTTSTIECPSFPFCAFHYTPKVWRDGSAHPSKTSAKRKSFALILVTDTYRHLAPGIIRHT